MIETMKPPTPTFYQNSGEVFLRFFSLDKSQYNTEEFTSTLALFIWLIIRLIWLVF
jgi:hypothetical protein